MRLASHNYRLLCLINGPQEINAGARLRITNWVDNIVESDCISATILSRQKNSRDLLRTVKHWLNNFDCNGNHKPVVIIQKSFSFDSIGLLLFLKLKNVPVIQDVCDPPIKSFNPRLFGKQFLAFIYLCLICDYLVDMVTVSSSVLKYSLQSESIPVRYINDCIDFPEQNPLRIEDSSLYHKSTNKNSISILWFGGAARPGSNSGIEELYNNLSWLNKLANSINIDLIICTRFLDIHKKPYELIVKKYTSINFIFFEWSIHNQSHLLKSADYVYLPRIQSLGTFYKSANRVALATAYGKQTISNTYSSEDFKSLNIILIEDFLDNVKKDKGMEECCQIPESWSVSFIKRQWIESIQTVCSFNKSKGLSKVEKLIFRVILFGLEHNIIYLNQLFIKQTKKAKKQKKA